MLKLMGPQQDPAHPLCRSSSSGGSGISFWDILVATEKALGLIPGSSLLLGALERSTGPDAAHNDGHLGEQGQRTGTQRTTMLISENRINGPGRSAQRCSSRRTGSTGLDAAHNDAHLGECDQRAWTQRTTMLISEKRINGPGRSAQRCSSRRAKGQSTGLDAAHNDAHLGEMGPSSSSSAWQSRRVASSLINSAFFSSNGF